MSDLFPDLPPVLSPRLQWMQEQKDAGMLTHHYEDGIGPPWTCVLPLDGHGKGECDSSQGELMASYAQFYYDSNLIGWGTTEIDAMEECATRNGIKLWNQ